MWDRLRFWRYDTFDKKVEAVPKTLTITETVRQKVAANVISEEEGEIL